MGFIGDKIQKEVTTKVMLGLNEIIKNNQEETRKKLFDRLDIFENKMRVMICEEITLQLNKKNKEDLGDNHNLNQLTGS